MIGGPETRSVEIHEYDSAWPRRFEIERAQIAGALPDAKLIEHIGSTSVPGLAAKPIVDIIVRVDPFDADHITVSLEGAGSLLRVLEPGHLMFRTPALDVHVHLWSDPAQTERHLLFRDWLRVSDADRDRYEGVKRELATKTWRDVNQYADAKSPVISEITTRAAAWARRGVASAPVTDDGPWQPELEQLARRRALAKEMGGAEKVERHHGQGKLTVRERIDALLDADSFREVGQLTGRATYDTDGNLATVMPANFVMGRGAIDGRTVVVGGDDFTVRGGAADASIFQKQVMAERMAHDYGLPIVRLVDGSGGGGSVKTLETERRSFVPFNPGWEWVVANLGRVPVVSLCLGSVAGLGAARVVASHYSLMVKGTSQLFVAGPPVVNRLGIEEVDKETLGGSAIHTRNGAVDDEVESEAEAFTRARAFLSYLPSSVDELPPRAESTDDPTRVDDSLLHAIPRERRRVYQARAIIETVVDHGSFLEIGRLWGRSAITGLARVDGWPVAILANDPYHYAGGWTADASRKVERFIDLAETFRLPVVHLVDNPGFVIGTQAEHEATIRHGARALAAIYQATVPWCSVILRKVYGVAGAAHQNASRLSYRFAWPSGEWGSLPLEGGIEAAYKAQLEAADDPDALRAEIETRLSKARDPFKTAEVFLVDDIVDPRETRPRLCEFANLAAPRRVRTGPAAHAPRP